MYCGGKDILFIVKKSEGLNNGKYLGIGGHFEDGESPYDCIIRELNEETGITLKEILLYTAVPVCSEFSIKECSELVFMPGKGQFAFCVKPTGKDIKVLYNGVAQEKQFKVSDVTSVTVVLSNEDTIEIGRE